MWLHIFEGKQDYKRLKTVPGPWDELTCALLCTQLINANGMFKNGKLLCELHYKVGVEPMSDDGLMAGAGSTACPLLTPDLLHVLVYVAGSGGHQWQA